MKPIEQISMEITPKAVILLALGGYSAGDKAEKQAEKITDDLLKFLKNNEMEIGILHKDGKQHLHFYAKNP